MSTYRYRVWCNDCSGNSQGCFGGGFEESEEEFTTPQAADDAAAEITIQVAPWEHEVIDERGKVVAVENTESA